MNWYCGQNAFTIYIIYMCFCRGGSRGVKRFTYTRQHEHISGTVDGKVTNKDKAVCRLRTKQLAYSSMSKNQEVVKKRGWIYWNQLQVMSKPFEFETASLNFLLYDLYNFIACVSHSYWQLAHYTSMSIIRKRTALHLWLCASVKSVNMYSEGLKVIHE